MSTTAHTTIEQRLDRLQEHLAQENPVLLDVVKSFRALDKVAYRLGLLAPEQSFATLVPWWPLISVVGTFSSGKSTFINDYLEHALQRTGNQAVDDKFTVVCYSTDEQSRTLPGLALDADPRFPFYQISRDIEHVGAGEGERVGTYLQLRTCPSEALRGKILIDSPGFDADEQRTSVLRITDHILTLSDLVLVLFDARHPEPGAMQDTLEHLVAKTIKRPDAGKFLYILNQVDNTAREDNPEEVFAAWQRALAHEGLTAGRFYRIYSPNAAIPINDEQIRRRFEAKRGEDLAEIHDRMAQVEVERAYRIIGVLEKTARVIESDLVPRIRDAKARWKRRVLMIDTAVLGLLLAVFLGWTIRAGQWEGLTLRWFASLDAHPVLRALLAVALFAGAVWLHFRVRRLAASSIKASMRKDKNLGNLVPWLIRAFDKNTRAWRPLWWTQPAGWHRFTRRRLSAVLGDADRYVQALNNRFASPSGASAPARSTSGDLPESSAVPLPGADEAVRPPASDASEASSRFSRS